MPLPTRSLYRLAQMSDVGSMVHYFLINFISGACIGNREQPPVFCGIDFHGGIFRFASSGNHVERKLTVCLELHSSRSTSLNEPFVDIRSAECLVCDRIDQRQVCRKGLFSIMYYSWPMQVYHTDLFYNSRIRLTGCIICAQRDFVPVLIIPQWHTEEMRLYVYCTVLFDVLRFSRTL